MQPTFTGQLEWYMAYGERHGDDGGEGRLVSMTAFTEPWDVWELIRSRGHGFVSVDHAAWEAA